MSIIAAALDRAALVPTPYPHLVVEEALPREIAETLLAEMPPLAVLAHNRPLGSNLRFHLPTPQALADPRISDAWKQVIETVNEGPQALLDWVAKHLGREILAACPGFEDRFGPLAGLKAEPRLQSGRRRNEVGMDAQIVVNSPALSDGTRVRGPHLDHPDKLISALLYLRPADDDSIGAELEMFEPLSDEPEFDRRNELAYEAVRHVRTYSYRHNLLVFPLSTPRSIHGVSPRNRTPRPRYHIHIVGEMVEPLFEVRKVASGRDPPADVERHRQDVGSPQMAAAPSRAAD